MFPNDLLAFVGSFIYVGAIIYISKILRKRGHDMHSLRETTHILMGVWPIFWCFFETKLVAVLVTLIVTLFLILAPKNIRKIYSGGEEKHYGLVIYSVMFTFVTFFFWMTPVGAAAIFTLAFADGAAGFIGKKYGKHKFCVFGRERSVEGSIAFFVASILSFLLAIYLYSTKAPFLGSILIYGAITTITEAVSPPHSDNLLIPIVAIILASLILVCLP